MQFIKFKSTQVFSNGSLFFCENNIIKPKIITLLEKDLKNFELNKKLLAMSRYPLKLL
jgi:hypothetical protein